MAVTDMNTSTTPTPMYVIKRDGSRASVSFDKITSRITKLCYGLNPKVCVAHVDTRLHQLYQHCIIEYLCNVKSNPYPINRIQSCHVYSFTH